MGVVLQPGPHLRAARVGWAAVGRYERMLSVPYVCYQQAAQQLRHMRDVSICNHTYQSIGGNTRTCTANTGRDHYVDTSPRTRTQTHMMMPLRRVHTLQRSNVQARGKQEADGIIYCRTPIVEDVARHCT